MKAPSKTARELIDYAKGLGFKAEYTRNCHLKLEREGCRPVFMSGTPRDPRSLKNTKSQIRRSLAGKL